MKKKGIVLIGVVMCNDHITSKFLYVKIFNPFSKRLRIKQNTRVNRQTNNRITDNHISIVEQM